ncbi:hypothetical protein GCM10009641_36360 [Mycobacterium cookii]|uniref:Uncharacterized protein n=1 Tax=Nocardioides furvisabuli TaxID=375542 RepID=A0ABP5IPW5_9ACTN
MDEGAERSEDEHDHAGDLEAVHDELHELVESFVSDHGPSLTLGRGCRRLPCEGSRGRPAAALDQARGIGGGLTQLACDSHGDWLSRRREARPVPQDEPPTFPAPSSGREPVPVPLR